MTPRQVRRYVLSFGFVALITLLGAPISRSVDPTNLVMVFLVAVVIAAIYLGRGPSILAAILSVLAFDFFFVPPHFTFAVADTQYLLTFAGLLIVGLVISTLTAQVREQADRAQRRELQTLELYAFSRDLAAAFGLEEILQAVIAHIGQTFSRHAVVVLPNGEMPSADHLQARASSPGLTLSEQECTVVRWAFEHGEPAGLGTQTQSDASIRCEPLKTAHGVVGVLGIEPRDSTELLAPEQGRLLESFASQAALAIERAQFAEQARRAQVLQETEKLQTALLNSISHDLRTPLVSITGALSSLQDDGAQLDNATRQSMVETAYGEAQRLNHLVGNLLDITRIEAGAMRVRQEPCDVQDVIGSALERLADRLQDRRVLTDLASDLPLVPMDFVLIVQVLVNLLENACKYSSPDAPIEIRARVASAYLELQVADRGTGIPRDDLGRIFDKFYRVQRPDGVIGTGLGLAICKGIVEAHRGQIRADRRAGGGTIFSFVLPLRSGEG